MNERPNCGKCHKSLFQGKPLDVNDAIFQRLLEKEQLPLMVFKDGQLVAQQAGTLSQQALRQWLQQVL